MQDGLTIDEEVGTTFGDMKKRYAIPVEVLLGLKPTCSAFQSSAGPPVYEHDPFGVGSLRKRREGILLCTRSSRDWVVSLKHAFV